MGKTLIVNPSHTHTPPPQVLSRAIDIRLYLSFTHFWSLKFYSCLLKFYKSSSLVIWYKFYLYFGGGLSGGWWPENSWNLRSVSCSYKWKVSNSFHLDIYSICQFTTYLPFIYLFLMFFETNFHYTL